MDKAWIMLYATQTRPQDLKGLLRTSTEVIEGKKNDMDEFLQRFPPQGG